MGDCTMKEWVSTETLDYYDKNDEIIPHVEASSATECEEFCNEQPIHNCRSWTYNDNRCWFDYSRGFYKATKDAISGVRSKEKKLAKDLKEKDEEIIIQGQDLESKRENLETLEARHNEALDLLKANLADKEEIESERKKLETLKDLLKEEIEEKDNKIDGQEKYLESLKADHSLSIQNFVADHAKELEKKYEEIESLKKDHIKVLEEKEKSLIHEFKKFVEEIDQDYESKLKEKDETINELFERERTDHEEQKKALETLKDNYENKLKDKDIVAVKEKRDLKEQFDHKHSIDLSKIEKHENQIADQNKSLKTKDEEIKMLKLKEKIKSSPLFQILFGVTLGASLIAFIIIGIKCHCRPKLKRRPNVKEEESIEIAMDFCDKSFAASIHDIKFEQLKKQKLKDNREKKKKKKKEKKEKQGKSFLSQWLPTY